MTKDSVSLEALVAQVKEKYGVEVPNHIPIPNPLPANEYEWWQFIEYMGSARWSLNHAAAHNHPIPNSNGKQASILEIDKAIGSLAQQQAFWVESLICPYFGIIPPSQCPNGNTSYRAGEEVSALSIKTIEGLSGQPVISPIPNAPTGKQWWWDWYNYWKSFGQREQNLGTGENYFAVLKKLEELTGQSTASECDNNLVRTTSQLTTLLQEQFHAAVSQLARK